MASFRKRGRIWYFRFTDADGIKREVKGCPDRRMTEELARRAESEAAKIRAGVLDPREIGIRLHEAKPLKVHLDDWHEVMLAKGRTTKHADLYLSRARQVATLAKAVRLSDLQSSRIQSALAALRDSGLSLETCNHHRASIRAFVRWARADGRLRDDPMVGVTGFNAQEDVRHERRVLSENELARLIQTAETGPEVYHMPGPLRAMAYRLAIGTGFRANEIRSLTPKSFDLDRSPPLVALSPSIAKNRRGVEQPISRSLAEELRRWLSDKPHGQPVLPLHHETAKAIRIDLAAAGIPYATDDGVADFHSLRGAYISALVRSGASVKTVQTLARHSNPSLTLKRYARADVHDVVGAVETLPNLSPKSSPNAEPMAATGTDGQVISERFAHYLPTGGDGNGRDVTAPGGTSDSSLMMAEDMDRSQVPENDGLGRVLSVPDGMERRGGDSNPRDELTPSNGLANRRFRPLSHLSERGALPVGSQ
jgi:integrase